MNFLVYGAGALGQAVGCLLASAGHTVDLLLRERFAEVIRENGLHVSGILGDYAVPPESLTLLTSIDQAVGTYDYVLITTKSYDTSTAVQDIASLGDRAASVVSMQSGCGNLEKLEAGIGPEKSLGARVITGFEILSPGNIEITVSADAIHIGSIQSGEKPAAAEIFAQTLTDAGHPSEVVADIYRSLFAKLLYNCTLSPLGAILGVHYGALAEREETRKIMDAVIEEVFSVLQACGGRTLWNRAEEYRQFFYTTLIPSTYNHRSSMLQDIENGKPTEVDSLVGYVSNKGRLLGVATPTCDLLADLVRFKERQNN